MHLHYDMELQYNTACVAQESARGVQCKVVQMLQAALMSERYVAMSRLLTQRCILQVLDGAETVVWCFLRKMFQDAVSRWSFHAKSALSLLQQIPKVAHLIASARLTCITAAAAFTSAEDTAPLATLLHTTMQSLHRSVSA